MRKFFSALLENWGVKGVSLFLAVLLWVFVHLEERGQFIVRLPVQIINIPSHLMVVDPEISEITVVMEGPKTLFTFAQNFLPRYYRVDLKDREEGKVKVIVNPLEISVPRGMEITQIFPREFFLELKEVMKKKVPVQVIFQGAPLEGYILKDVDVQPPMVEVEAPVEELKDRRVLRTEKVSLKGKTETFVTIVPLDLSDIHIKSITTQEVEVTVYIVPRMIGIVLDGVPVEVVAPSRNRFSLRPSKVRGEIYGPEPLLRGKKFSALVKLEGELTSPRFFPVTIPVPEGVEVRKIHPPRVQVVPLR